MKALDVLLPLPLLPPRLAFGEPAGDAAAEGDAATPAGEASVVAFLAARCFTGVCAGDSPGVRDYACAIQVQANPTTGMRAEIFVINKREANKAGGLQSIQFGDTLRGGFSAAVRLVVCA